MELKGFIWARPSPWDASRIEYSFWVGDGTSNYLKSEGYTPVAPHTITFEPIDPKAMIEGQVNSLLARKEKLETECKREVERIDDAIANLRCLEFSPTSAD